MVLHGHRSRSPRLAVITEGIASGKEPPVRIMHFPEGFTLFDAEVSVEHPELCREEDLSVICEGCLLERYPGLGRGMELARECGEAQLIAGRWQAA